MNTQTHGALERYIGNEVVDQEDNKIGKLTCLWADNNNQPAYLGVKTSWLFGKTHVVPADRVEVNGFSHTVRLPYSTQQVKDAPSFDPDAELDSNAQSQVRSHYNLGTESNIGMESAAPASASKEAQRTEGTAQEAANVQLQEEQMKVGKRQVDAGGIRLRKVIRTETVNQPVELQHEEVVVERVPGGQSSQPRDGGFQQQDVFIPLRREEPVVQKEARVREEVRVSKKAQSEPQTINGQVRKEDLEVQRTGSAAGSTSAFGQRATRAVFGLCQNEQQATKVVDQLKRTGFSDAAISVHMPDRSGIGSMLMGMGILEYEAKRLEGKCRPGTVLISVKSVNADETSSARDVFQSAGVSDISETGGRSVMDKAA